MFSTPSKRRKTSATTSISATNLNTNAQDPSAPTTPTRASYQSPTKASLARSHPHLVNKNNEESQKEPRGRLLRNELLGRKSTSNPPVAQVVSPSTVEPSKGIAPSQTAHSPESYLPAAPQRSPLQQRQPAADRRADTKPDSLNDAQTEIVPRLVKQSEIPRRAASRQRSDEPDLPPTPVELGLDAPPDRPRGLSSSSPRGSKSGSGRRRVRLREGQSVTSSPLKPKAKPPIMHDLESEPDVDEAPSEPPAQELPDELRDKRKTLDVLRKELEELQTQMDQVESAMNANDLPSDTHDGSALIQIIQNGHKLATAEDKDFEQESEAPDYKPPFANLCAPGNLQLHTKTATKMVRGRAKVVHEILATAPPPWSSDLFKAKFEVITDAEDARVEKITWVDVLKGRRQAAGIQDEIYNWIQERLKNELHRLDLAGLVWGLGVYFDASIQRARAFRRIAGRFKANTPDAGDEIEEDQVEEDQGITDVEAMALSSYLTISQLAFDIPTEDDFAAAARRTRKASPGIIATWSIRPTWHGNINSNCELALSGVSDAAQEAVVELFNMALKTHGFEHAFGAVWDMVVKEKGRREEDEEGVGEAVSVGGGGGAKAGRKKRKRFT